MPEVTLSELETETLDAPEEPEVESVPEAEPVALGAPGTITNERPAPPPRPVPPVRYPSANTAPSMDADPELKAVYDAVRSPGVLIVRSESDMQAALGLVIQGDKDCTVKINPRSGVRAMWRMRRP